MRKSSVLLAIISIACALSAAWSWRQLRAEHEKVATLEQQLAAAQKPATPLPVSASPVMALNSPSPISSTRAASSADHTEDEQTAREQELREQIHASQKRERELMRDPAYRKARIDDWRRRYAQTRADALRVLGLTPAQADGLIDLSIERNMKSMELVDPTGRAPDEKAQAELRRLGEAHDAQLRDLLGEEKFERWNWYQASMGERSEASQFRAQLSTTSEPMQDRQAEVLVESLYTERQRRSREYEEYATAAGITDRNVVSPQDRQRWLDLEKESNQRIHDTMAATLSRAQLSSLDEMLAANLAPIEAALRLQLEGRLAKSP